MPADEKAWVFLCHVEELEHDLPRCYRVNGVDVFIVRHWEKIYAMENRCGHMGAPLHRGDYTDGLIICGLHGAAYDVETGEKAWDAILPPPMCDYERSENARLRHFGELMAGIETLPLRAFPLKLEGESLYIQL
jgi:nitrite reductase/ring-hydroxylating ferredoxin subunit